MIFLKLKNNTSVRGERGFTLIEMLITLAIVGMMMSAVYAVHISNVRAIDVEEERVEIQQDQRISLDFITRQLRMAGYNKAESTLPQIVDARSNYIYFTADLNDDKDVSDTGEHVAFCLYNSANFGRALSYITGNSNIGSTTGGNPLPTIHNHATGQHEVFAPIEDIEFLYTLADGSTTTNPDASKLEDLRSVAVTILSRADTPDPRWTDNQVYVPASGVAFNDGAPYGDRTRRRMMTANIRFRNMGL